MKAPAVLVKKTPLRHGEELLARFDELPDSALVPLFVAGCELGLGRTRLWELRQTGQLETVNVGSRSVRAVVGSVRRLRAAMQSSSPATLEQVAGRWAA